MQDFERLQYTIVLKLILYSYNSSFNLYSFQWPNVTKFQLRNVMAFSWGKKKSSNRSRSKMVDWFVVTNIP